MTLKEFLSLPDNNEVKLAGLLEVSQGTVNRYANGKRWPDRDMIIRIKAATHGAVDFDDWFSEEFTQSEPAA